MQRYISAAALMGLGTALPTGPRPTRPAPSMRPAWFGPEDPHFAWDRQVVLPSPVRRVCHSAPARRGTARLPGAEARRPPAFRAIPPQVLASRFQWLHRETPGALIPGEATL